ncbi:aspartate/glutamate racemase family protein [Pseudodonghicola flavimaris]|uniref:Aspartate/glutamate racemase family protein n=1 Tax=Pseudodonghicola flavimaris TaxID=3050036 RepID=A0ABT7F204_9RHOB|nr:aspartate/glutamate racemase family protein [Pseudodonghicola flavimaris]MDK3018641.1 aspartate/glutamate racemase family protein [Pseudodonghicola flavimaris]
MDLLIVNSNTSVGITALLQAEAAAVVRRETRITAVTAPFGPAAIETPADVEIAAQATHAAITGAAAQYDAAVIACFSDPGLMAIRREVAFPVIGIAEAAMFHACMLGARFSILTVAPSAVGGIRKLASAYGIGQRLSGIHALDRGVLESHRDPAGTARDMLQLARDVLDREAPDVLVLGGAITAGMTRQLAPALPVPVLDGLSCAVRQAEIMVRGPRT